MAFVEQPVGLLTLRHTVCSLGARFSFFFFSFPLSALAVVVVVAVAVVVVGGALRVLVVWATAILSDRKEGIWEGWEEWEAGGGFVVLYICCCCLLVVGERERARSSLSIKSNQIKSRWHQTTSHL